MVAFHSIVAGTRVVSIRLHLKKDVGETKLAAATPFNAPKWLWPVR